MGSGRVWFEPPAPEIVVRNMLRELDRTTVPAVVPRLEALAQGWRVDLARIFSPPARRADLLWQILSEIPTRADLHVIVPSREHLSHLDPAGRAAVAHLTDRVSATMHFLERTDNTASGSLVPETGHELVIVESRIGAIPAAAQLDAATALSSRSWPPHLMEQVDAVYMVLINTRHRVTPASVWDEPTTTVDAVIRTLIDTSNGRVVVELDEPHVLTGQPPQQLLALCAHVERIPSGGHTVTRATLPTTVAVTDGLDRCAR
ncbi:hypothetical protein [Nocardia takedensis]|uniref:hypothetical protein n=1 Tax=Nocardia takedensis TaxID=259390 RepID=UPI0003146B96|nr:hypothetical protein [Nocardia takedensis]